MNPRIVLASRGDFASTVAIRWLIETYHAEVVALTLDLGQRRDPGEARERALAAGAVRAHVIDARDEFAHDCVLPAIQDARLASSPSPAVASLAWPLIARKLVEVAELEGAFAVAHVSTSPAIGELVRAARPGLQVIACAREWIMTPGQLVEWAHARGMTAPVASERAITVDDNLWGRTVTWADGGDAPVTPADLRRFETVRAAVPASEAFVEISFDGATPVAVNGVPMPLTELIEIVSVIAAQQGVGRMERVETGSDGLITRVVHEAPAAMVLETAYAHRPQAAGAVRVKLSDGQQTVVRELVHQA